MKTTKHISNRKEKTSMVLEVETAVRPAKTFLHQEEKKDVKTYC